MTHLATLPVMISRAAAVVVVSLSLAACGSSTDEAGAPSSSSSSPASSAPAPTSEAKGEGCLDVSKALGDAIAGGGDGLTWKRGAAVKSTEHKDVYYIAGVVGDGQGEVTGVWGTTSLEAGGGLTVSVDGFAEQFTNWPKSGPNSGDMSVTDDGAVAARGCLEQ